MWWVSNRCVSRQAQQDSMVQKPVSTTSDFFAHNSDFFLTILNYFLIYVPLEALKGAFLKATESLLPGDRHREQEKQEEKDSLFLSAYFVTDKCMRLVIS